MGVLIWIQSNILVWKYGLLDGQGFNWPKENWRGWLDGFIWVFLIFSGVFFSKKIYSASFALSIFFLCLQVCLGLFSILESPEGIISKENNSEISYYLKPPDGIFEFSSQKNVIQIVLDAFQSDIFQDIMKENPEYQNKLDGFYYFPETTGSYPTTRMSIPAYFSGHIYRNEIPMNDFIYKILNGKTIPNVLYDKGYQTDMVYGYLPGRFSNIYNIPIPSRKGHLYYERAKTALILDISLFRCAPHFLKKYIYNNQNWFLQSLFLEDARQGFAYFAHYDFMNDMISNMSASTKTPVYKYIHLFTTHYPIVVNADCEFTGEVLSATRENVMNQCNCSLNQIIEFFEKMKIMNIYDSALIILHADHGAGQNIAMKNFNYDETSKIPIPIKDLSSIAGSALPLLAIKPPYQNGALKTVSSQAMLTDIPATISSLIDLEERFDGVSVFDLSVGKKRDRKFYYYKWKQENWQDEYFQRLDEFIIRGSVYDINSWIIGEAFYQPEKRLYETKKIDFGKKGYDLFKRYGWGGDEVFPNCGCSFNWALGNSASIILTLPKKEPIILSANIASYPFEKPQEIIIKVDGKIKGKWEIKADMKFVQCNILIEPEKNRPHVNIVEFIFSQHYASDKDKRPLAVAFESVTIEKALTQ